MLNHANYDYSEYLLYQRMGEMNFYYHYTLATVDMPPAIDLIHFPVADLDCVHSGLNYVIWLFVDLLHVTKAKQNRYILIKNQTKHENKTKPKINNCLFNYLNSRLGLL